MLCLGQCVALVAMCFWFFFLFFIPLFLKLKKSNGSGEFMCVRNVCIVVVVLPGQLFRQLFWQKASTTLSFSFLWNLLHPSLQIIRTWALPGGRSLLYLKKNRYGVLVCWLFGTLGELWGTQINHAGIFGLSEELIRDTWTRVFKSLAIFRCVFSDCAMSSSRNHFHLGS